MFLPSQAECPEGVVHENSFKDIYAKFFPHGSKFSFYDATRIVPLAFFMTFCMHDKRRGKKKDCVRGESFRPFNTIEKESLQFCRAICCFQMNSSSLT